MTGPGEVSLTVPSPPLLPCPQASGDGGWSNGWAHASGRVFLYACQDRKVFGGWNCSPGRTYGQPFSHPKKRAKMQNACREGADLKMQRNSPDHILWTTGAN